MPGAAAGAFVAVVGPSGVGKDSVIAHARRALVGEDWLRFPRRLVTRPPGDPSEDHVPIDAAAFERQAAAGLYAAHWRAHGLAYALPAAIDDDLAAGRIVVANVSRSVVEALDRRYGGIVAVTIGAAPAVLAERLARRGRESAAEIAERLARRVEAPVAATAVVAIDNSGPLPAAGEAFVALLRRLRLRCASEIGTFALTMEDDV